MAVHGAQQGFNGADRYDFRKDDRFTEFYLDFIERVRRNQVAVFQPFEKCLQGCDFTFGSARLVGLVELREIGFQERGSCLFCENTWQAGTELVQVDAVSFQSFAVQAFLGLAELEILGDCYL